MATLSSQPVRVLLIDNEEEILSCLMDLMRRFTIDAVCVQNFTEAEAKVKILTFDVIVSDLHIPGGTLSQLVNLSSCRTTPLIVMTGDLNCSLQDLNLPTVQTILYKPFRFQELIAQIRTLTGGESA